MPKKIDEIMNSIQALPSIPGAATKLLSLLEDPDATADQVENILRYEPGLTATILKMTNSAYFGIPTKIGSVRQAVVLLGWKRVSQLVLTACVGVMLNDSVPGYALDSGGLWRHAISVSFATEEIARMINHKDIEELFTAALLHDIGKLVLGSYIKEEQEAIEDMIKKGMPFEIAEHMVLGTDHAEIGSKVLENWSFPETVTEAVRWHHDPEANPTPCPASDMVHVADVICLMMGMGVGWDGLQYEPSIHATKRLGLSEGQLESIASRVISWADDFIQSVDIPTV